MRTVIAFFAFLSISFSALGSGSFAPCPFEFADDVTLCSPAPVVFDVRFNGELVSEGDFSWDVNTGSGWSSISGENSSSISVNPSLPYTQYRVNWSGFSCDSGNKIFTVVLLDNTPPTVWTRANCSDGTAVIIVQSPESGYNYEWKDINDNPVINGGNDGVIEYSVTDDADSLSMWGLPGTQQRTYFVRKVSAIYSSCASEYTLVNIIYRTPPTVAINSTPATVCHSTSAFSLVGTPSGGSWYVDNALSSSTFLASSHSVAGHLIEYSYTDTYGCNSRTQRPIMVRNPAPIANQVFTAEYNESTNIAIHTNIHDSLAVYKWYYASTGGSSFKEGVTHTTTVTTSPATFYIATKRPDISNCEGTVRAVITVNPGLPNNYNWVREEVMMDDSVYVATNIDALDINEKSKTMNYIDGLGRPLQTVQWMASPGLKDVVQPVEYDLVGREAKKFLPYVSVEDDSWLRRKALKNTSYTDSEQRSFYNASDETIASDSHPYALSLFDKSPLNRVIEQGAPGVAWQPGAGHAVTKKYELNKEKEVLLFRFNELNGELTLAGDTTSTAAYYAINTLFRNETKDEEQHDVVEFVDKQGRTVCRRVRLSPTILASTYYIYDEMGNLVVVLPPEAIRRLGGN